jgi:hypothetical protein
LITKKNKKAKLLNEEVEKERITATAKDIFIIASSKSKLYDQILSFFLTFFPF